MIKLKTILLQEDLVDDLFGTIALGSDEKIADYQGFKFTEEDTVFEQELIQILQSWVNSENQAVSNKLFSKFDILKKASERFPKVLKPETPDKTLLYRGVEFLSEQLEEQLAKTNLNDYEVVLIGRGKYWKYPHPIQYKPRSSVQSWTSRMDIATDLFANECFLTTEQNDEFLFNQTLMHIIFKSQREDEILHFGKDYSYPVYIALTAKAVHRISLIQIQRGLQQMNSKQDVRKAVEHMGIPLHTITVLDDLSTKVSGNVNIGSKNLFKIPIKFEEVDAFFAGNNNLTTLENSPTSVRGDFYVTINKLTTLEGGPQKVGNAYCCDLNNLTTLKGAPSEVGGNFLCDINKLTSLQGAPVTVGGYFSCDSNKLTSLEGAPKRIGGMFTCSNNKLVTLKGAPKLVRGRFWCTNNNLTTLEGGPEVVEGDFNCSYNNLTSLRGAPKRIHGHFICIGNDALSEEEKKWANENIEAEHIVWG